MKTELRPKPHTQIPGATVVELWHDGQFIGEIAGADGPGARIISKHAKSCYVTNHGDGMIVDVTITVGPESKPDDDCGFRR